ncbi:MAG TPA: 2OG-Fe(II) oxygenase [Rhizomicrobium sp.]|jgi:peroxiredoxin
MADVAFKYVGLAPGDPAPWFKQRTASNPSFVFDSAAGRYIVLCFFGSAADPAGRNALRGVQAHRLLFDDEHASFFGISLDPTDEKEKGIADAAPGIRFFWDFDGKAGKLYGALPLDPADVKGQVPMRRFWMVLDPSLRVLRVFPLTADGAEQLALFEYLKTLPAPSRHAGFAIPAPVLVLPNVFEPDLCRALIDLYETKGGEPSGFMREENGKTVLVVDPKHKRRRDILIEDEGLIGKLQARVERRIVPEVKKVHQFTVTRMERYIVSCYAAEEQGHFRPHRDNTTKGTAHRRFAVSVNLNADFEGGELSFPEYGAQRFKMPAGCAVVFSCSLLHMVSPVTRGKRYAFLPFLYDDAAARMRIENNKFLDGNVPAYVDPEIVPATAAAAKA